MLRLTIVTARLQRMPLPRLLDIGVAMMAAPNPWGHTLKSFTPPLEERDDARVRARH